ncbi:hypothetical protein [Streptomyces silaceus]|uniref:hypothetical protein n=1 Tax=Streptomyces silaceus TaxID=545123 RepID=UPI000B236C01|nr:hypothetical protein [Streptomyces silaceus]
MARTARQTMNALRRPASIYLHSTQELVAQVESTAAVVDKKRRAKGHSVLRRKPTLHPVARAQSGSTIELTPWQVLHALARGYVLSGQGMGHGLAEHWLSLKFCEALDGNRARAMDLTERGRTPESWYKGMQARELAVGFGLAAAEHIVQQRYPGHIISVVDTGTVLRAGWPPNVSQRSKSSRPRPDYILEAWKPGEPSKITFVACRGNHQQPSKRGGKTRSTTLQQLIKGAELTEGMQIGDWNTAASLMLSTELIGQGGIVVNVIESPGDAQLPLRVPGASGNADDEIRDRPGIPYPNAVQIPAREGQRAHRVDGFQVGPDDLAWFGQLLARTGAAGLTAFAGGGPNTARYLTARQGQKHYQVPIFAATSSVDDAEIYVGGVKFVGTDHVFRLGSVRVEAFSGMAENLYKLIKEGEVERYRRVAHKLSSTWGDIQKAVRRTSPFSLQPDGTVMALRILPIRGQRKS